MKINCISSFLLGFTLCISYTILGQSSVSKQFQIADTLLSRKQWEEALVIYQDLFTQSKVSKKDKGEAAKKMGESYNKMGDFNKSEVWYNRSTVIYKELKLWEDYYDVQSGLARTIEDNGRHDEAIQISEKVIKWHTDKKDTVKLIKEYYNYSFYHYYDGQIQKAIKLYNQTIELAEGKDEYTQAMSYNELGNIWAIDLNNEKKALEYYMKSLRLKLKIGVPDKSISISYNNIGISHKNLGRLDSAMYYYEQSLKYADKSGLAKLKINPLQNIANLQKKQGDFKASIQTFNQILELEDLTTVRQKISIYTNLGILHNQLKNYSRALHYLVLAENLTDETDDLIDKADIQTQLVITYIGLNNYEKAFSAQEKLIAYKDSIHKRESKDEFADLMLKYETAEKNKTIADQDLIIAQKESGIAKRNMWISVIVLFSLFAIVATGWLSYRKRINSKIEEEQKVNRAIFESEQKERIRIARDLHDSIGQKLSGMKMLLSKNKEDNEDLKRISSYLDETATEVRNISHNLVPEILNLGFIKALENLIEQLNESKKVEAQIKVSVQVTQLDLPPQTEVSLYRIVQEIMSNIIRHSQTEKIYVNVFKQDEFLQILIEDKGIGFDTQLIDQSEGLGWKNIFARIKLVNGQINVKSQAGKGSEFLINIPII